MTENWSTVHSQSNVIDTPGPIPYIKLSKKLKQNSKTLIQIGMFFFKNIKAKLLRLILVCISEIYESKV